LVVLVDFFALIQESPRLLGDFLIQPPGFQKPKSFPTMPVMAHPKAIDSVSDMPLCDAESASP